MAAPFSDSGQTLEDFVETVYVRCPQCHKRAQVRRLPSDEELILADDSGRYGSWRFRRSFSSRKVSCLHCSYTCIWKGTAQQRGGPYDWYFRLPLWLQTPCCGEILWTFNEEHLSFLERYVTAKQRIKFHAEGRVRNGTMASRLPVWIKSAKNRDEVVKGIARLKRMLEGS
jgi:DNA-directed RNA polymerase subunit RPC12/RpoP